jgi:hypothetical protein
VRSAVTVIAGTLGGVVMLAGCKLDLTGATCNTNDNCPVRQFCSVPVGARQGTCKEGDRFEATLALSADPPILPAGGTTQAVATLTSDGGPPVPDGGLVTELVDWSVAPGSEAFISVSNDAGTRGLVDTLAPGEAVLVGSINFADQRLEAQTRIVVSNAALQRIIAVADRIQYAPGTPGSAAATGFFSDGTHADLTSLVAWSSSAPAVLGVSNASGSWGRLSALAPGKATLHATYLALTGATSVVVGNATLVGLSISPLQPRGLEGEDLRLDATGLFSDGTAQTMTPAVQWSADDQAVGYFASPGVATLLSPGSTTVRAVAGSVQASAELEVALFAPVQMEISPAWPDPLLVDSTTRLTAWATHQDGTVAPATVDWSSSDPSLTISPLGDLSAASPGLSTVAASMPPVEASALAEATADAGVSWLVWPPEVMVPVGAEGTLALERAHGDGTVQDLTGVAGWRPAEVDAGLVDVDTGDNGGDVRPRVAGERAAVLAILPGHTARGFVRSPTGSPTVEIVPAAGAFPARSRTHLAAVGHWPDGTVLELTGAASWSASPEGLLLAGNGPSAGLVLGADAGTATMRVRFDGASAQAPMVAEPDPGKLEVWPAGATLAAGTALALSVILVSGSGESTDVTSDAVWISNAPKTAIVANAPGQKSELLARAGGTAVLTASLDGLSAQLNASVTGATLQAVVPHAPPAVLAWAPVRFLAIGQFSDGSTQDLTRWVSWTSSDPALLRIRGTGADRGAARGMDAGVVEILARPRGGQSAGLPVTVNGSPLAALSVTLPLTPVAVGTRPRAQAVARAGDGTLVDVTGLVEWISADPTVATVSSLVRPGWMTTLRQGTTTVTARFDGLSAGALLTVTNAPPASLTVDGPATLATGAEGTATATATLSGGGSQVLGEDVVWSSDQPSVLGVSNAPGARGRLLGLSPGSTTVRARTRSGLPALQGSATVTVSGAGVRAAYSVPLRVPSAGK